MVSVFCWKKCAKCYRCFEHDANQIIHRIAERIQSVHQVECVVGLPVDAVVEQLVHLLGVRLVAHFVHTLPGQTPIGHECALEIVQGLQKWTD